MVTNDKNQTILLKRVALMNQETGPRVGDYLKLPYGLYTRFTHKWDDCIQTGGGTNSYYLGSFGGLSYSGGLNPGVKLSEIKPTDEKREGMIWFFKDDYHTAHNSVHYSIEFRVWEPIEGADLSGCYEIAAHEKAEMIKKLPSVPHYNGNEQLMQVKLPKIYIKGYINDGALANIKKQTGLDFSQHINGSEAQPTQADQYLKLLLTCNLKTTYYNNSMHENVFIVEFNH